jgi:MYXO-CTERM domain-containing protein
MVMGIGSTRIVLATVSALAAIAVAPPAYAFCRSTTVAPPPDFAPGGACWDQGKPLFWRNACAGFSVQKADGKQLKAADVATIMAQAFGAWTAASCTGGGHPSIAVTQLASTTVDRVEYNLGAPNANLVVMRDDTWPHPSGTESLALTTLTFDADTGEIFDADIEIDTADNKFAVADPVAADGMDLRSILTHQAGHFLGLAHSADTDATMFPAYSPGTIDDRIARADDVAAVCAVYAPGGARATAAGPVNAATCDATPRGGLELTPPPATSKGCAVTPEPAPEPPTTGIALAALTCAALAGILRTRRRLKAAKNENEARR